MLLGILVVSCTLRGAQLSSGTSFRFDVVEETTLRTSGGAEAARERVIYRTFSGKFAIEAVQDNKPSSVRLEFDRSSGTTTSAGGNTLVVPSKLAGRTVLMSLQGNTMQPSEPMDLDEPSLQALRALLTLDGLVLPPDQGEQGQSWEPDAAAWARALGLTPDADPGKLRAQIDSIATSNGRSIAHVTIRGELSGRSQGLTTKRGIDAQSRSDASTGKLLSFTNTGTLQIRGTVRTQGREVPVDSIGSTRLSVEFSDIALAPSTRRAVRLPVSSWESDTVTVRIFSDRVAVVVDGRPFQVQVDKLDGSTLYGWIEDEGVRVSIVAMMDEDRMVLRIGNQQFGLVREEDLDGPR
jgi:hypothetical protein